MKRVWFYLSDRKQSWVKRNRNDFQIGTVFDNEVTCHVANRSGSLIRFDRSRAGYPSLTTIQLVKFAQFREINQGNRTLSPSQGNSWKEQIQMANLCITQVRSVVTLNPHI